MSKRITKNGITTIKGRAVTIKVNDRELDKLASEGRARQAETDEHFRLLDAVSQAKSDIRGTMAIMTLLIKSDRGNVEGVPETIERWLQADMGALDRAFDVAWDGILRTGKERDHA